VGIFSLLEASIKTVTTLPLGIAKDVVTLGGALTDEESATLEALSDIYEDIDDIAD